MLTVTLDGGLTVPRILVEDYKRVALEDGEWRYGLYVFVEEAYLRSERERCPNCKGPKGYGKVYAPTGEKVDRPYHYGGSSQHRPPFKRQLEAYNCPICSGGTFRSYLVNRCGVSDHEAQADSPVWRVPGREKLVAAVDEAVSAWTTGGPSGWLTLVGPYGSGKTFLAQRAVRRLVEAQVEARYVLAHHLARALRDAIDAPDLTPDAALDAWRRLPVLAIDQLDWERQHATSGQTTFATEHLIAFLDDRYRERHRQATLLIVNLDWWEAGGGEFAPILSRCYEGVIGRTGIGDLRKEAGAVRREALAYPAPAS